jgi:hypothetical protein
MPPSSPGFGSAKPPCSKKASGGGRDWADTGQRSIILELRKREEIQEKNELLFLSLELQVTIIRAVTRKILVS